MLNFPSKANQGAAATTFTSTEEDAAEMNSKNWEGKNAVTEFGQTLVPTSGFGSEDQYQLAKSLLLASAYSLSASGSTGTQIVFSSAGASGNSLPDYADLQDDQVFRFRCLVTNTGAMTVDWNGDVKTLLNFDLSAITAGQLVLNSTYNIMVAGSIFLLLDDSFPVMTRSGASHPQIVYATPTGEASPTGPISINASTGKLDISAAIENDVDMEADLQVQRHFIRGAAPNIGYPLISTNWDYDWMDGHTSVSYSKFNDTTVYGSNCYGHETSNTQLRLYTTGVCSALVNQGGVVSMVYYSGTAGDAFSISSNATMAVSNQVTVNSVSVFNGNIDFQPTPETPASASNGEFFLNSSDNNYSYRKETNNTILKVGYNPYWGAASLWPLTGASHTTTISVIGTWYSVVTNGGSYDQVLGDFSNTTDTKLVVNTSDIANGTASYKVAVTGTLTMGGLGPHVLELGVGVVGETPTVVFSGDIDNETSGDIRSIGGFAVIQVDDGETIEFSVRNTESTDNVIVGSLYADITPIP